MKKYFLLNVIIVGILISACSFAVAEERLDIYDFKMGMSELEVMAVIKSKYTKSFLTQPDDWNVSVQVDENGSLSSHSALNLKSSMLLLSENRERLAKIIYMDGKLFQIQTSGPKVDFSRFQEIEKAQQADKERTEAVFAKLQDTYEGKITTVYAKDDTQKRYPVKYYSGQNELYDVFYDSMSNTLYYSMLNHDKIVKTKINDYEEAIKLKEKKQFEDLKL